eukprot:6643144-Prymnesium_polylepis.1
MSQNLGPSAAEFQRLWAMDPNELAERNQQYFERLKTVAPRTDDNVEDDACGVARAEYAAWSKAQKE